MHEFLVESLSGVLGGYLYPFILEGMLLTIELALLSLFFALVLGFLGAIAKLSNNRSAKVDRWPLYHADTRSTRHRTNVHHFLRWTVSG